MWGNGMTKEITEKRLQKLNAVFESYAMVAEGTDVYVCDVAYDYSRWSKKAVELYGLPGEYMYAAGDIWESYVHPDDRNVYRSSIDEIFANGYGMHDVQYRAKNLAGKYNMCTCKGVILKNDAGEPEYFVGMIRNHSLNESVDNVTGLRNKNGFFNDVSRYLDCGIPFRIVMYGATNYTGINDLFGYDFGTRILQHCIRYVQDHNQNIGDLYRLDGVRVALISRTATIEQLRENYRQYQEVLQKPFLLDGRQVLLEINAGAVAVDRFDTNADTIFSCLTRAYQESKYNKQGDFSFFENGNSKNGIYRLERINRIRNSVIQQCSNFEVFYQPIMTAENEELEGAEALIRWIDEGGNIVPPDDFIPVLENDALFPDLGEWILRQAMKECREILKTIPDFVLNVNLSYAQLQKLDFLDTVKSAMEEVGYPPENLCLEITERCRFLDMERLMAICCDLNRYGIKVALDDFGTGFSSLSILQSLHIDILKIDRQFVKDIVRDNRQERLVRSIGKVGEIFGSRICVEGVETEEMRDILRKFDVYTFQGYLYSKPIPHREFMKRFVEKHADAEQ